MQLAYCHGDALYISAQFCQLMFCCTPRACSGAILCGGSSTGAITPQMAVLPRTKMLGARGLILSRLRQESGVIKLENDPLIEGLQCCRIWVFGRGFRGVRI